MLTTSLPHFRREIRFALFPFRSLLLRESLIYFLLLPVLRCFNSQRILLSQGNSEILGSKLACSSPKLIAACHVFHRNQNQAIHLTASVIVCPSYSKSGKPFVAYFIEHDPRRESSQIDKRFFNLSPSSTKC
jgi:hypothetical protein